jgi:hypothetical protein
VVGDGDRAEPDRLRGLEQAVDGGRAVVRVVRVHVQVDRDQVALGDPLADIRQPVGAMAAVGDLPVQRLELVGDPRPGERVVRGAHLGPQRLAQVAVADQARELSRERVGVARLEQQPELAVVDRLLVLRQPGRDRDRPAGHRAQDRLRRRRCAVRRGDEDLRAREELRVRPVVGADEAHAVADRASERHVRQLGGLARPHGRRPRQVGR